MAIGAFSSDNDDGVCSFVFISILLVITVNTVNNSKHRDSKHNSI